MKSAAIIHVYYFDEFSEILQKSGEFDYLYITCADNLSEKVKNECYIQGVEKYEIIVIENVGFDIYPFIKVLDNVINDGVDLICKLHTKRGSSGLDDLYSNIKPVWKNLLISSMLADYNKITSLFKTTDIEFLFPASCYKSSKYLDYGNAPLVTELLMEIGFDGDPKKEVGFVAGTMFWAKTEKLKPLLRINLERILETEQDKMTTSSQNGTYWHAMERLFGYLPHFSCKRIALSFATDFEHCNFKLIPIDINDSRYINRSGVGLSLVSELFIKENYYLLKKVVDENNIRYSETNIANIDPIIYYLRYGVFFGEELLPNFDSFDYWRTHPYSIDKRYNPLVHYILSNDPMLKKYRVRNFQKMESSIPLQLKEYVFKFLKKFK